MEFLERRLLLPELIASEKRGRGGGEPEVILLVFREDDDELKD